MIPLPTRPRSHAARRALALGGAAALAVGLAVPLGASAAAAAPEEPLGLAGSQLYVNPWSTTLEAAQSLSGQARDDAQLLGSIPSADWFTSGTPAEVEAAVDAVVTAAAAQGRMPLLVAYNLPFRDCAQYSAGGAAGTAEYLAWIDGFAAGIGDRPAAVILEPDGLGIIPHYVTLDGVAEWCQPAEVPADTAAADRFAQLNGAVDAIGALPAASVYLDGTGSSWLNVGEISDRLLKGGVERADGFFLNASNYQFTANSTAFGTWISQCIAYVTQVNPGDFGSCGNQYWAGGPANNWGGDWPAGFGGALSPYGEWSADAADPALDTSGVQSRYELILGGVEPTTRFVIDTSRNGLGPWQYPVGVYPAHEDWCNPPDRGLGLRPDTTTGVALVDAYLWIKVPGESDGKCYRGTTGPLDPERGMEDPAAGQWFVEQARELIALANPPIAPLDCHVDWVADGDARAFSATVRLSGAVPDRWTLAFAVPEDQQVTKATRATVSQQSDVVAVAGAAKRTGNAPDTVVHAKGAVTTPWQFLLGGRACTS
ncbi:glycoside hydrolase family 6 protein [Microbacterium sp. M3]|uniref:Glucanase n=1 Tax=Microbacterium arthrosphaerae TaxID=792652 RepID=A0ABU4GZW0_9MICO|nr:MULTISPECIES: glycoside hydrolase family 6 protein [Microbacterium]MDW4572047.1 glycoside hydrolase family 6 protein [Microbacterium arthrosphaerae]MDW7605902.1 glycoside hydrolase family 6 protein [Microbacterium sp. M3]